MLIVVVPLPIIVAVSGHQVVKTVVIPVTVAFPTDPVLVADTPDTLTDGVLLLGVEVVNVRLAYQAEVSYAEVV